jgi:hypothetical protein
MNLLDVLKDNEDALQQEQDKKSVIIPNLVKRMYFELDVYSTSLIYIWKDNNRVKINMDGANEIFEIKHGTKFHRLPKDIKVKDDEFKNYIHEQISEFFKRYDIDIYGFYMDERKIIFKIKALSKVDLEKCLY